MSKPEDIPQDVVVAAKALTPCYGADRYCRHESDQSCEDGCEWFDSVAKAIVAERERCARKADPIELTGGYVSDYEKQAYDLRTVIAASIRAKG